MSVFIVLFTPFTGNAGGRLQRKFQHGNGETAAELSRQTWKEKALADEFDEGSVDKQMR
jgi:hypothetical protein